MAYPKFNRTGGLRALRIAAFHGYSLAEDPDSLKSGYLVEGSKNIDLSRVLGALAKRRGVERQIGPIDPPATGGIRGIHTYRAAGERVLLGYGTSLYRLTGEALDIAGDLAAGTFNNTEVISSKLQLLLDPEGVEYITSQNGSTGEYYTCSTTSDAPPRAFRAGPECGSLSSLEVRVRQGDYLNLSIRFRVYADASLTELIAEASQSFSKSNSTFNAKIAFANPVSVEPGMTYYLAVHGNPSITGATYRLYKGDTDTYGLPNGFRYAAYGIDPYYREGEWLSPVYDLGSTPAVSVIEWAQSLGALGTTAAVKARGSDDGQVWGYWQGAANPGVLPLTRFIQLQVHLTGGAYTPAVWNIGLDYETSFTDYEEIKTGLSGNKLRFADYDNDCYFTDGGRPRRYDGSDFTDVGVDAPAGAPAIAASGETGDITGAYRGKVTFVNAWGAESNASPASGEASVTGKKISWTNIPVGADGKGIVSRKLYRTKAGGSEYFLVAAIGNNVATTYTDNITDANLITPMPADNGVPPNATIVYEHKDYMCYVASGDQRALYFSKRGLPDSVPPNNYKQFPGAILAVRTYQDALIVGGASFTAAVYGDIWGGPLDNTKVRVISEDAGPVSHEAMKVVYTPQGDILAFPSREQLLYLSPGLQENSLRSIPLSDQVAPIFRGAVNRQNMAAAYYGHKLYIALTYFGEGLPVETNNIIMAYDGRTGLWNPPWTIAASGFTVCYDRLYIGSPAGGAISEMEKATSDDGSNIHAVAVLKPEYTEMGPQAKKKFRQLRIAVTPDGTTDALILRPAVDGVTAEIAPGPVSGWGGALVSPRLKLPLPRGYQFGLTIEDDSANDWTVSEIVTEYERGD